MAWQLLASGVMQEMRHHPFTSLTALLALILVCFGLTAGLPLYTHVGELNARVKKLEQGQTLQIAETLENRLITVRAALFDLQAKIEEIRETRGVPDRIYFDELKRLRAEEVQAERRLTAYLAAHRDVSEL